MKKTDIIGIGSAFIDYFFETDKDFLHSLSLEPEDDTLYDEKQLVNSILKKLPLLKKSSGGSTPNTLAVLAGLGANVAYYGVIGKDKDGEFWKKNLKKVSMKRCIQKGHMSVCACLLTNNGKERTFVSQMNKFDNVFFDKVDTEYINSARYIHIAQFFSDVNSSFSKLKKLVKSIKNSSISFSPGIAYSLLGIQNIKPILKKTNVVFINTAELKILINKEVKKASKELVAYGPKIVVCTLGEKGCLVTTQDEQFFSKGKKVKKIVDTTGAGDAFAAGFLYGLLKKKPLKWSANFANKIASKSVTDFGLHWLETLKF